MVVPYVAKGAVVVATLACGGSAFSIPPSSSATAAAGVAGARPSSRHVMAAAAPPGPGSSEYSAAEFPTSRKDVLGVVFGAAAMSSFAFVSAADAKDDPALKGTKADPEFVTCLSDCIYFCTKSKEQSRSRQECIPECRQTCAKTKAQGMIGAPRTSE
ncbi:unnamed protein product [Ectocarpus sp. CCAP 1310/34]|nr:unnamed protein product [Ectocarpus sp. CCAP 1310/34]